MSATAIEAAREQEERIPGIRRKKRGKPVEINLGPRMEKKKKQPVQSAKFHELMTRRSQERPILSELCEQKLWERNRRIMIVSMFGVFLSVIVQFLVWDFQNKELFDLRNRPDLFPRYPIYILIKLLILGSTLVCIGLVLDYYLTRLRPYMTARMYDGWVDAMVWSGLYKGLIIEVLIHALISPPYLEHIWGLGDKISLLVFLRLYLLLRFTRDASIVYYWRGRITRAFLIFQQAEPHIGWYISIISFVYDHVGSSLVWLAILQVLISTFCIWVVERDVSEKFCCVGEVFYFTLVTMTTIGYGDISPATFWGRAVAMGTGIWAIVLTILAGSMFVHVLEPTPLQNYALDWVKVAQSTALERHHAAACLQLTWRYLHDRITLRNWHLKYTWHLVRLRRVLLLRTKHTEGIHDGIEDGEYSLLPVYLAGRKKKLVFEGYKGHDRMLDLAREYASKRKSIRDALPKSAQSLLPPIDDFDGLYHNLEPSTRPKNRGGGNKWTRNKRNNAGFGGKKHGQAHHHMVRSRPSIADSTLEAYDRTRTKQNKAIAHDAVQGAARELERKDTTQRVTAPREWVPQEVLAPKNPLASRSTAELAVSALKISEKKAEKGGEGAKKASLQVQRAFEGWMGRIEAALAKMEGAPRPPDVLTLPRSVSHSSMSEVTLGLPGEVPRNPGFGGEVVGVPQNPAAAARIATLRQRRESMLEMAANLRTSAAKLDEVTASLKAAGQDLPLGVLLGQ